MKKIGIFTINDNKNYGNRLQNYAAQEYLKSLGFDVETIKNTTNHPKATEATKPSFINKIKETLTAPKKEFYRKLRVNLSPKLKKLEQEVTFNRKNNFENFTKAYLSETAFSISDTDIPEDLNASYDYFVTGSDQVWNPNFFRHSKIDFLAFADKNKRIAFSPSFGVSELPDNEVEQFSKWISEMDHLSVREDAGAKIIKELTGREAEVLVDPTLLLDKSDWLKIAEPAHNINDTPFLLTYFLGGVPKEFKKQINDLARKNNLKIINLGDLDEWDSYIAGPSQFIDYISKCSVFCTDSFHGAVFSILFEKPFVIYQRQGVKSMYSRINTLLDKFDLNSRKVENLKTNDAIFNVDYSHVPQILEKERAKVFNYLKQALELQENE